jgi:hypothetical protein
MAAQFELYVDQRRGLPPRTEQILEDRVTVVGSIDPLGANGALTPEEASAQRGPAIPATDP